MYSVFVFSVRSSTVTAEDRNVTSCTRDFADAVSRKRAVRNRSSANGQTPSVAAASVIVSSDDENTDGRGRHAATRTTTALHINLTVRGYYLRGV